VKSKLKISCWNTEWASPKSKRGRFFRDKFDSDVICVTEGYEALLPDNGYVISSDEDYGYKTIKGRRKVILWSKNQWTEIDNFGSKEMPTGRFISGITMGIRFIGICIPWRFAHVSTGRKDRKPWEDHISFIKNLTIPKGETVLLGDFNQNIPRKNQPEFTYDCLVKLIDGMKLLTSNMALDHIVISKKLMGKDIKRIPTFSNSDHDGISCLISKL
jgi:exonuclease III